MHVIMALVCTGYFTIVTICVKHDTDTHMVSTFNFIRKTGCDRVVLVPCRPQECKPCLEWLLRFYFTYIKTILEKNGLSLLTLIFFKNLIIANSSLLC